MRRIARALVLAASLLGAAHATAAEPVERDSVAADSSARDSSRLVARGWRLHELGAIVGDESHPLVEPSGVLSDAFGRIWASDASLHKLRRWRPDGVPLDEAGALGSEPEQFRRPGALARVGSLGVAVLDIENRRVSTYDHNLRLLSGSVDLTAADLEDRIGRVRPLTLASDRGGALYVVDAERDRILVFDYAGAFQRELGGFGGRSGGFAGLTGIAVSARGRIVSVERPHGRPRKSTAPDSTASRARIQWFEAGGRLITSVWSPPLSAGASELSLSIAVDGIGRIAIAAERSGEVFVLTPDGAFLAKLGGLAAPRAVAFADDGTLLVAEAAAGRVRRWALEPERTE
jgi:hypothetical protein